MMLGVPASVMFVVTLFAVAVCNVLEVQQVPLFVDSETELPSQRVRLELCGSFPPKPQANPSESTWEP